MGKNIREGPPNYLINGSKSIEHLLLDSARQGTVCNAIAAKSRSLPSSSLNLIW